MALPQLPPMHGTGATESLWMQGVAPKRRAPLPPGVEVDVCVVGGGIAGVSCAYELQREGLSVALLERDHIGSGETARTTAHLSDAMDDGIANLETWHGRDGARMVVASHGEAIRTIEENVRREGIDCQFARVPGYTFAAPGGEDGLHGEAEAARRAGLQAEATEAVQVCGATFAPALRYEEQAQLHPLRYLHGLADAFERHGGTIYDDTPVKGIEEGHGDAPVTVTARDGTMLRCRHAVVATNAPFTDVLGVNLKQAAYRTYAIAFRVAPEDRPDGLYWSTHEPYYYIRGHQDNDGWFAIVGGKDHRTGHGDPAGSMQGLRDWARSHLPLLGEEVAAWSGQVLEPADGAAFIGRDAGKRRILLATGDSGQGMTHGTLAARLLADQVMGRRNPWADVYDPSRLPKATGRLLAESMHTNVQYLRWLLPGEDVDAVPVGAGRIVRRGLTPLAVYRESEDRFQVRHAACTHLGGIVAWNETERTWDCPLHGSRFTCSGAVLCGPANTPLHGAEHKPKALEQREAEAAAKRM